MDSSFLYINFKTEGGNNDTRYVVQVRSTELVHN